MGVSVRKIAGDDYEGRLVSSDLLLRRADVAVAARVADVGFDVKAKALCWGRGHEAIRTSPDRIVVAPPPLQPRDPGLPEQARGGKRGRRRTVGADGLAISCRSTEANGV